MAAEVGGLDLLSRPGKSGLGSAYRGEMIDRIDLDAVRAEGYGFQVEMTYFAAEAGGRIVEVPIKFVDRVRGTSKMSMNIVVEAMALVTWWGIRDRVLRRKRGR